MCHYFQDSGAVNNEGALNEVRFNVSSGSRKRPKTSPAYKLRNSHEADFYRVRFLYRPQMNDNFRAQCKNDQNFCCNKKNVYPSTIIIDTAQSVRCLNPCA